MTIHSQRAKIKTVFKLLPGNFEFGTVTHGIIQTVVINVFYIYSELFIRIEK